MEHIGVKGTIEEWLDYEQPLSQRAVRGGVWIFALRIFRQAFNFIRLIVVARLLVPHDFGLLGVGLLMISVLETFSETGFHSALIQKKENIRPYLDTAWTVLLLRGIILFSLLMFGAPYVSGFFKAHHATVIIQALGFSILFRAFTNIGVVYFQKELKFNKLFIYKLSGTLTEFVVTIAVALMIRNVWALVLGLLAGDCVRCLGSYVVHRYKPRLSFDLAQIKELTGFGKWVFGSSILLFLISQGDDLFVGKFLGVVALGLYQIAFRVSNIPVTEISNTISQVTLPLYSKLQEDIIRLRNAYLKILSIIIALSCLISGLIFILAADFTMLFLGEKWMPMVSALKVLCVFAIARSIGSSYGPLFLGANKPRFLTITAFIKLVFLVILIYPLTRWWGLMGTALATTIPVFISQSYGISRVVRIIQCRARDILIPIAIPLGGIAMMLIVSFFSSYLLPAGILLFSVNIVVGIVSYSAFIFYFSKYYTKYNVIEGVKEIIKKLA